MGNGPQAYVTIIQKYNSSNGSLWVRDTYLQTIMDKLNNSLQRLALMTIGHFRQGTPTAGLEALTFTMPLWIHIRQEAAMAYIRTIRHTKISRESMYVASLLRQ